MAVGQEAGGGGVKKRVFNGKCTEAQRDERVARLAGKMARDPTLTKGQLKKWILAEFGLKHQQAMEYVGRARRYLDERTNMPNRHWGALVVNGILEIAAHGTNREKLHAYQQLAAIKGLEAPRRLEHAGPAGGPVELKHHDAPRLSRERALELIQWAERSGGTAGNPQAGLPETVAGGNGQAGQ